MLSSGGGLMMAGERRLKRYRARLLGGTGGAGGADGSVAGQDGLNAINVGLGAVPVEFDFYAPQGDLAEIIIGRRGTGGKGRRARLDPDPRFDQGGAGGGGWGWRVGGRGGCPGTVGAAGYGGGGGGSTALRVASVLRGVAPGTPGGKGACAAGLFIVADLDRYTAGTYAGADGAGQEGASPPPGQEGCGSGGGGGGHDKGGNAGNWGSDAGGPASNSCRGNSFSAADNLPYSGTIGDYSAFAGRGEGGLGTASGDGDGADGQDGRVILEDVETGQSYVYDVDAAVALP
ncbi:hypothetical protein F1643_18225 [Azospirillum sp. INR13]|uniref:hypothetical protein n=1 Tax=Azospirillum sp. INR13 TaxID=2596919 RepID=UPI00189215E5|nr:hypothetical protein [Azospirillum sp. INR13]MBF5096028.1 hypothetical protein [Azospirillum sp. INR13]